MTTTNRTKTERLASDRDLLQGIAKRPPNVGLIVASKTYAAADLGAMLQQRITLLEAAASAHATWLGAVAAANALLAQTAPVIRAFEQQLRTQYAQDQGALADYGLAPVTRTPPTAEKVAAAVVQRRETRALRGTRGKKAVADLHAPPVTLVPAAPAPSPAPAAPAAATPAAPPKAGPTQ